MGRSGVKRLFPAMVAASFVAASHAGAVTAPRDVKVEIRGAEMHLRLYPGGKRVILLESGSGLGADTWNDVAPLIAKRTGATVISYDRAGMGSSEGLESVYDVHDEIARIHAALYALKLDRDLTLVGHSYGGYLIQLYANLYPGDVKGMVYVDANTVKGIDGIGGAERLAAGRIKANDVPDPTPYQRANLRLSRALVSTQEMMRRYPPICGVPVAVITAGKQWPETPPAVVEGWRAGHAELVRMTSGRAVVADGAGHMLHKDRPDVVIDEVARVFNEGAGRDAVTGNVDVPCG
jgi:pimeloyl-ACP methyl ester carboxylesterase